MTVMSCSIINDIQSFVSDHPSAAVIGSIFAAIGLCRALFTLLSYIAIIVDSFVLPSPDLKKYGAKNEGWAIITGCTQGIGEEFAYQLAAKGFNVGLVARREGALRSQAELIQEKYPNIKAKYFTMDVAADSEKSYQDLKKFAQELGDVGVLVNNVGVSHDFPVPFLETTVEELRTIINVNVTGTLKITQVVAPLIAENIKTKKIKRGLILNLGSMAGATPTPLLATYSGSKSFLQGWNNALAAELSPLKIDVQLYIAYLVASSMSKIKKSSLLIPNPRQFVKSCIQSIGRRNGAQDRYATSVPYWSHALFYWNIESTLGLWSKTVSRINYKMHLDIRRKALKRLERQSKQK